LIVVYWLRGWGLIKCRYGIKGIWKDDMQRGYGRPIWRGGIWRDEKSPDDLVSIIRA
jgi:hypothetical protein